MKMATQVSAVHPYDMQAFIAKSFCCKQCVHLSCNGNSLRTVDRLYMLLLIWSDLHIKTKCSSAISSNGAIVRISHFSFKLFCETKYQVQCTYQHDEKVDQHEDVDQHDEDVDQHDEDVDQHDDVDVDQHDEDVDQHDEDVDQHDDKDVDQHDEDVDQHDEDVDQHEDEM
nr:hypothetical protein BgiMline_024539 [Biomphalaria glabrata]